MNEQAPLDAPTGAVYHCTKHQERLWLLHKQGLIGRTELRARVHFSSPISEHDLKLAWREVIARHEMLRAKVDTITGFDAPMLVVAEPDAKAPEMLDISASFTITENGEVLIDLSAPPAIADERSLTIALRDLTVFALGEPPSPLQTEFIDYADYCLTAAADDATSQTHSLLQDLYKNGRTEGLGQNIRPTERAELRRHTFSIPFANLRNQYGDRGVEGALFAAWARIASLYSGDGDTITIDRTRTARQFDGLEIAVGPFLETTPLNFFVDPATTPKDLQASAEKAIQDAEAYSSIFDRSQFDTTDAHLPFHFHFSNAPQITFPSRVNIRDLLSNADSELYHISLSADVEDETLTITLLSSVVDDRQLEYISESLQLFLTFLAQDNERTLASDRLIGSVQRAALAEASRSKVPPSHAETASTLIEAFNACVTTHKQRPAIISDGRTVSFAELEQKAHSIAALLQDHDLSPGAHVAVIAERNADSIIWLWGCWLAGGVYIPINPNYPELRLAQIIHEAEADYILVSENYLDLARRCADDVKLICPGINDETTNAYTELSLEANAPAYMIFTSGSTGRPRGVMVSHSSACNLAHALAETIYANYPPGLRLVLNAPFSFDASIKQLLQTLSGHCLIPAPESARRDAHEMIAFLNANDAEVVDCTPGYARLLLDAGLCRKNDTLKLLLIGGEAIDEQLWKRLADQAKLTSFNLYGPTEATVNASVARISGDTPTIGAPLPNVTIRLLSDDDQLTPFGVDGEIAIGGAGVATGYLGDGGATAEKFTPDPWSDAPGGRLYKTGDRARLLPDGSLAFIGRNDNQVKVRGHRVELGEVEAALQSHPDVRQAAVVTHEDGEGKRIYAYAEPTQNASKAGFVLPTGASLKEFNRHETVYVYDEIFSDRTYMRGGIQLKDGAVIFDVGANIGLFSIFASFECKRPHIYAFEPLPPLFDCLENNLQEIDADIEVYKCGLSENIRTENFVLYQGYSVMSGQRDYQNAQSEVDVIKRYLSNQEQSGENDAYALLEHADEILDNRFQSSDYECSLRTVSDIIREREIKWIDLLKIDVQRAERDVLRGISSTDWDRIGQVAMEVHDEAGGPTEGRLDEITELLEDHGFDVIVEQADTLRGTDRYALYAVKPAYRLSLIEAPSPTVSTTTPLRRDPLTKNDITLFLKERLAEYMLPAQITLVEKLPLTVNGKLDRTKLPDPSPAGDHSRHGATPPTTPDELKMAEVWKSVLGVPSIGVTDNFFELGGDSIRSIRTQVEAEKQGLFFPLQNLFTYQTIRDLVANGLTDENASASVDLDFNSDTEPLSASLPEGVEQAYPMSRLQTGMIYHSELTNSPRTYHNVSLYRIAQTLDIHAFRKAANHLCKLHPILRTSFDLGNQTGPVQLVHKDVQLDIELLNTTRSSPLETARDAMRVEADTGFNFAHAPLIRLKVVPETDRSFLLLISEHHAILDGWSLNRFLIDLSDLYAHYHHGAEQTPPAPSLSPQEAVALERRIERSPNAHSFWREKLAGAPRSLLTRSEPASRSTRASTHRHDIDLQPGVLSELTALAERSRVSVKHLALAAHCAAISIACGSHDVVTGLVCGVRPEQEDSDRVLGLFINMAPFRVKVAGSWLDLASACLNEEIALLPHRFYPLSTIEHELGGPFFNTFFNFTHFRDETTGARPRFNRIDGIAVDIDFCLAVDFEIDDDRLKLYFQYDNARFSHDQAQSLGALYQDVITTLIENSAAAIATSPLFDRERFPPSDNSTSASNNSSPTTSLTREERHIAEIWSRLLGVAVLDPNDDFFAIGGHSLLAVRLLAELRMQYAPSLTLNDILNHPTIIEQAALVQSINGEKIAS